MPGAIRSGQLSSATPCLQRLPGSPSPPIVLGEARSLPSQRFTASPRTTQQAGCYSWFGTPKKAVLGLVGRLTSSLAALVKEFSSLRVRLAMVIFIAIAPTLALMFYTDLLWLGLLAGVLAIVATWVSGGQFVLRHVKSLVETTHKLAAGDFSVRTKLGTEPGELGELARAIDSMTASLAKKVADCERAEKTLFDRAHQQTVVAALGQYALTVGNLAELLEQAVLLISTILEVEYCEVLELLPEGDKLLLRAGTGWKKDCVGNASVDADARSPVGYAFMTGEPVIIADMRTETRFSPAALHRDHGVVSGVSVVISGQPFPFGVLGVQTTKQRTFTEDEVHLLVSVATIIAMASERKRSETQLHKLAAFAQVNPNPVLEFSSDGQLTYFNDAATRMSETLGVLNLKEILPPDTASITRDCLSSGRSKLRMETKLGSRTLSWSFFPVTASNVVQSYVEDVTDRLELEAQLRQSQKMESIGQLAAGVAHDFNNMLTVIQGHAGMILSKVQGPKSKVVGLEGIPAGDNGVLDLGLRTLDSLRDSAQAVCFAAERAANLTRQLLMFSRKNVMQPRSLDLRETVGTMTKMLQRLLGETVSLEVSHPADLPTVKGDPGMIEQVIMNLAVNARDAMPRGGTLKISTSAVCIDEQMRRQHREGRTGAFVCLSVSDTGCGMDEQTLSRIFEPFFTTKEVGKGTGLGLATVYGIVKQHEGWVEVASEPGKGSTFTIFFPALALVQSPKSKVQSANGSTLDFGQGTLDSFRGKETILVVEDEPVLREMANIILQECGYRTLEAATGIEALSVWEHHRSEIDLVLTDMVMPEGMTGKELAEKLTRAKPGLKVVFTSGYSVEDLGNDTRHFLQKPYNRFSLAETIRTCLDN